MSEVIRGRLTVHAGCHDCGKFWSTNNGFGLAAQHADKYDHETWVETTHSYQIKPS